MGTPMAGQQRGRIDVAELSRVYGISRQTAYVDSALAGTELWRLENCILAGGQ